MSLSFGEIMELKKEGVEEICLSISSKKDQDSTQTAMAAINFLNIIGEGVVNIIIADIEDTSSGNIEAVSKEEKNKIEQILASVGNKNITVVQEYKTDAIFGALKLKTR